MTPRQYAVDAYRIATGWLGWSDEAALSTPIPRIHAAYDETIKRMQLRAGGGKKPEPKAGERVTVLGSDTAGLMRFFDAKRG